MYTFILNNQTIETDLPPGMTVLDFVRYEKNLKGTKIGCREGDCGACTILVGQLAGDTVNYRTMTSCLMPLANAVGKHIVTVEGINTLDGGLNLVQQAMVDESGTQCGFCTVGFVMSLTGVCINGQPTTCGAAVSAIDGNICRCTGYKSIERACARISSQLTGTDGQNSHTVIVPAYFKGIPERLRLMTHMSKQMCSPVGDSGGAFVAGGTDLYVQKHEEMVREAATNLFDLDELRFIRETDSDVEIGASVVVTDLLESPVFNRLFPNLYKHLKLVSSTPIRNMATIAGNFVNASPIGDMTAFFLALNAEVLLSRASEPSANRWLRLSELFTGYKKLAKKPDEFIHSIRFAKNFTHFNFEKVCKRTFLDIASVNTAISLDIISAKADVLIVKDAHLSIGGVAATPLYLKKTSEFLKGKELAEPMIDDAAQILQDEISPISDVRGSSEYKRLLAGKLFRAHFWEMFGI